MGAVRSRRHRGNYEALLGHKNTFLTEQGRCSTANDARYHTLGHESEALVQAGDLTFRKNRITVAGQCRTCTDFAISSRAIRGNENLGNAIQLTLFAGNSKRESVTSSVVQGHQSVKDPERMAITALQPALVLAYPHRSK
jgi:hypothetical protein